ncbi:MAG: ATPase [candidate division WWE3 bacterium GW2011_GWD2_42_11]|nr:MAG: ATPase [candidate division WWE3 bacterium GW2011_GWD2_42_11]
MYCKVRTFFIKDFKVIDVCVEVTISSRGIPRVEVTGVKGRESAKSIKMIRTAFSNSGLEFPNKKVNINVLPEGLISDLADIEFPVSMGILFAHLGVAPGTSDLFYGGMDAAGSLVPATKIIFMDGAWSHGRIGRLFIPEGSHYFNESKNGLNVYKLTSLSRAAEILIKGGQPSTGERQSLSHNYKWKAPDGKNCFCNVLGNENAKRALTISISGHHNILMLGPSGTGKSLLAEKSTGMFPSGTSADAVEIIKAAVMCGQPLENTVKTPFRCPHISIKETDLIGGPRMPGEATLAHKGILFLDEMHLFAPKVLNSLKTVVDQKKIDFNCGGIPVSYPADFLLMGAANSCMCGLLGAEDRQCKCNGQDLNTYNSRMNPALLERFDILTHVTGAAVEAVRAKGGGNCSSGCRIKEQINNAVAVQRERFKSLGISYNSQIPTDHINSICTLGKNTALLLEMAVSRYGLSTRAVHRILCVSRTVADLESRKPSNIG